MKRGLVVFLFMFFVSMGFVCGEDAQVLFMDDCDKGFLNLSEEGAYEFCGEDIEVLSFSNNEVELDFDGERKILKVGDFYVRGIYKYLVENYSFKNLFLGYERIGGVHRLDLNCSSGVLNLMEGNEYEFCGQDIEVSSVSFMDAKLKVNSEAVGLVEVGYVYIFGDYTYFVKSVDLDGSLVLKYNYFEDEGGVINISEGYDEYFICGDSDNGIDPYTHGNIFWERGNSHEIDYCINENLLMEYYCGGNGSALKREIYCDECDEATGSCISPEKLRIRNDYNENIWDAFGRGEQIYFVGNCADTDFGMNYFVDGKIVFEDINSSYDSFEDECLNDSYLLEYYCSLFPKIEGSERMQGREIVVSKHFLCPHGCSDNRCIVVNESSGSNDMGVDEVSLDKVVSLCDNACSFEGGCYPIGYRMEKTYCSGSLEFINQLKGNGVCNNNFECVSNLCIDGSCVEKGFFDKIISWFGNLFG